MALVPVVLILVPLAALVLGVSGQTCDPGGEPFLFGQPVARSTILVARWLGESAALAAALIAGLGVAGGYVALNVGVAGLAKYAFFVAAAIVAAIASATEKRVTALGIGTFVWFFFVLLYDGAALSLAAWLTGSTGGRVLFGSIFGNPADLVRVVVLSASGTPHVLGAAGEAWLRFLGGTTQATLLLVGALALWTIAPLAIGARVIAARDL